LSIRERMRALGGRFEIASACGKGTTAVLELPLATQPACLSPDSILDTVGPSDTSLAEAGLLLHRQRLDHVRETIVRVLLVDDHAMMRQGLRSVLEAYSDVHIVGEAQNGEEAVTLVHELRPSVVIMDINMPKLNGIEATARIKSQWPQISVIGLSVNAEGPNQTAMLQAGATRMMTKEAAVEELYQAIQASIGVTGIS
jgi:CheY-like chemotaxis protein